MSREGVNFKMSKTLRFIKTSSLLFLEFVFFLLLVGAVQWLILQFVENPVSLGDRGRYSINHGLLLLLFGVVEEELKYRYFLTSAGVKNLSVSLSLLIADFTLTVSGVVNIISIDVGSLFLYYLLLSVLTIFLYAIGLKKVRDPKRGFYILASLSVIFSVAWHICFTSQLEYYSIINLLISHVLYGLAFIRIRLKYGFLSVIIFHLCFDLLVA